MVYSLDDLDKLTFDYNAMSVWTNKGTNKTDYAYDNIGLLTFREGIRPVAGIEMLTAADAKVRISYDRDAEMVIVISEKPLTGLLVCDLQGRTVARQIKTANCLQLSLASLPLGVYIVKTQGFSAGKSAKIIK